MQGCVREPDKHATVETFAPSFSSEREAHPTHAAFDETGTRTSHLRP